MGYQPFNMKKLLVLFFLLSSFASNSQIQNKVFYEADLMEEVMIRNNGTDSQLVIYKKALGVKLSITVDTIFRKYSIYYTDKDNHDMGMVYEYVSNYFGENSFITKYSKSYLVKMQGYKFFLEDYMDTPIPSLQITWDELYPNNCTLIYKIDKVKRVKTGYVEK